MDLRVGPVRAAVDAWKAVDDRGSAARISMLNFLDTTDEPFSREAQPAHVTGSAVVMSSAGFLLHRHKLAGIWCGPGGHVDGDEWPWEAALRETVEETGVKAVLPGGRQLLVRVDVHPTVNHHVHYDLTYVLVAPPDEPSPPPEESQDVRWFELDEALATCDEPHQLAIRLARGFQVEFPR